MPHQAASCAYQNHQRLKNSAQFRRVFSGEKPFFTRHFVVHYRENDCGYARLGVVVSKKVSKKAVVRNLIKRHIRNAFRLQAQQLPALDFVVVGRSNCALAYAQQKTEKLPLQGDIFYALDKIVAKIERKNKQGSA